MTTAEVIHPAQKGFGEDTGSSMNGSDQVERTSSMNVIITGTVTRGLGMVIVGGYKEDIQVSGIFVKNIRAGGPVEADGQIKIGDQLLSANGISLIGVSNEKAVQILKECAKTDEVELDIARDATSRSNFKRLSQILQFPHNLGMTPPEVRNEIRHSQISTERYTQQTNSESTESLTSVSDVSQEEEDFRSSSTPAVLEDELNKVLSNQRSPIHSSEGNLESLRTQEISPLAFVTTQRNYDASQGKKPFPASSTATDPVPPPPPVTLPPNSDEDDTGPPPLPSSAPPEEVAPPLPASLPPAADEKSGSLRKKLTFSIKKTVGIGITIKEEVEESGRSGIYVDKIIRGLDSAKDGRLKTGDCLLSINEESYEDIPLTQAQKQLTLLKSQHNHKIFEVTISRIADEEEIVAEPVGPLVSTPPPLSPPKTVNNKNLPDERISKGNYSSSSNWPNSSLGEKQKPNLSPTPVTDILKTSSQSSFKKEIDDSKEATDHPRIEGATLTTKEQQQAVTDIFDSATLPIMEAQSGARESTGSKKERVSIDPNTPMRDTPPRRHKDRETSMHARLSMDPNTKVKLSKLEIGLKYTGHTLTQEQQAELRKRLDVDDNGKVLFSEFIEIAKDMFAFELDENMFEPGSLFNLALSPKDNIEPPIFSQRGYSMISNSDSSHSGSQPASMVESPSVGQDRDELERMRQQLYQAGQTRQQMGRKLPSASDLENASLKKHLGGQKEEIARLKALLVEKDHANRELQVKLENTLRTASARSNDAEALRKKLSLCEAACKAAKIKEAKLNETLTNLETQLSKSRKQVLEQTPAELRNRMAVLDCQLRKEQALNKRYQIAVELLLEFAEKAHDSLSSIADVGAIVFHPRGKGESARAGDQVTGNPRPPQYLSQHSKRTNVTLAQEAQEAVKSARKILRDEGLPVGWEVGRTENGQKYYINHQDQTTSWVHPTSSRSQSRASTASNTSSLRINV